MFTAPSRRFPPRRRKHFRLALVALAIVAVAGAATIGGTQAYLTDGSVKTGTGNAATLPAVATLTATSSGATNGQSTNLSWSAAPVSAAVNYTVQRSSVNDFSAASNPTTVYQGTGLSTVDTTGGATITSRKVTQVASGLKDGNWALIGGNVYQWGRVLEIPAPNSTWFNNGALSQTLGIVGEVKQITAGWDHMCALTVTGSVYCAGFGDYGQLGRGSTTSDGIAAIITDPNGVFTGKVITQITAGSRFACALTTDGTMGCWGANDFGQLGNPGFTAASSLVPIKVAKADGATHNVFTTNKAIQISAGYGHVCALKAGITDADGNVTPPTNPIACWGYNAEDEMGTALAQGTNTASPLNINDPSGNLAGAIKIDSGQLGTCVVTSRTTGTNVMCWGGGDYGVLGNASAAYVPTPTPILTSATGFTDVSVGLYDACASKASSLVCWGINPYGNLGNGTSTSNTTIFGPTNVTDANGVFAGTAITSLSDGAAHTCATSASGALACWGNGDVYQIGQGTGNTLINNVPTAVLLNGTSLKPSIYYFNGQGVTQLSSSGGTNACTVDSIGAVRCWGTATNGATGNGTDGTPGYSFVQAVPILVTGVLATKIATKVAVGSTENCALTTEKRVYCWGRFPGDTAGSFNSSYPLAVDTTGVLKDKDIVDIAAGASGVCALASDGTVACWGPAPGGAYAPTPRVFSGLGALTGRTVVQIRVYDSVACAITSDNKIACWGANTLGAIGDSSASGTVRSVPTLIDDTGISSGSIYTKLVGAAGTPCVITSPSTVYCWGRPLNYTSGGASVYKPSLESTPGLNNITDYSISGDSDRCAINDGELYCWGANANHNIGTGATAAVAAPSLVSGALYGKTVTYISKGGWASCALTSVGAIGCWGDNATGMVGSNYFLKYDNYYLQPRQVEGSDVTMLCMDSAIKLDGAFCSLAPARTYYYRVSYTIAGVTKWVSAVKATPRS